MSQSNLKKVFSKLRIEVGPRRRFRNPLGPEGRLLKMRKTVTALVKHERIELSYHTGDESRGYAERLISEAIRYGEFHKETMELASYWLLEKQLVHKLFKVLVPRYQDCKYSYTRMWRAPREYPGSGNDKCVLELRENIYPSLARNSYANCNLLHNKLLDEMRREYLMEKQLAASGAGASTEVPTSNSASVQTAPMTANDTVITQEVTLDETQEDTSGDESSNSSCTSSDESRDSSPERTTGDRPSRSDSNTVKEDKRT